MAQKIIALQDKGGSGKSTLVTCLAHTMSDDGARVLIIDTDRQGNAMMWGDVTTHSYIDTLVIENEKDLKTGIQHFEDKYDVILIDTAGYQSQMANYAIAVADLILIPSGSSRYNIMGAASAWKHAKHQSNLHNLENEIRVVFWNIDSGTAVYEKAREALTISGIPTLPGTVGHLTGFEVMSWTGGLPQGTAKRDVNSFKAALQIDNLLEFYNVEADHVAA